MKNLRDFFNLHDLCPLCMSKDKELTIFYSKYPKGKLKFSISKRYITMIFENGEDVYSVSINIDSNDIVFGEESFGPLVGGDYLLSLACSNQCIRYEAYTYYDCGKIKAPKMLTELICVKNDDSNFAFETNHLSGNSLLTVSDKDSTIEGFHSNRIKLPLIKLSSLPLNDRKKLLDKFKNYLLLS